MDMAQLLGQLANSGVAGVIAMFIVLLLIVVSVVYPIVIKVINYTRESTATASSNSILYTQLSEQLTFQQDMLNKGYQLRNELTTEVAELRGRIKALESIEVRNKELQQQLKEKDAQIASLKQDIEGMKQRVHSLELRLAKDEQSFCINAPTCDNQVGM